MFWNSNFLFLSAKTSTGATQTDLTMADIAALESDVMMLRKERTKLQKQISESVWGVHRVANSDKKTHFYTGLQTFAIFMWLFKCVFLFSVMNNEDLMGVTYCYRCRKIAQNVTPIRCASFWLWGKIGKNELKPWQSNLRMDTNCTASLRNNKYSASQINVHLTTFM